MLNLMRKSALRMELVQRPDRRAGSWPLGTRGGGERYRLVIILLIVAGGYLVARIAGVDDLSHSPVYLYTATSLLAVGLYGSTYTISLTEARRSASTVVAAVTLGVLGKSLLIGAITFVLFRRPVFFVLGVAVAQIDPLSVAVMNRSSSMSTRAKSILAAWASFDDPVTVLITIYAAAFARRILDGRVNAVSVVPGHGGALGYLAGLGANLAFAAVVGAAVVLVRVAARRGLLSPRRGTPVAGREDRPRPVMTRTSGVRYAVVIGVLIGLFAISVWQFWMLGLALIGLCFRPQVIAAWLERAVAIAFVLVAIVLGMLLARGIDLVDGVALGAVAFAAQACVSLPLTRTLQRSDRVQLALAQQNGVTAILLALLLQPMFPQATAIVGPAILTINALHQCSRAFCDRRFGTDCARGAQPSWRSRACGLILR